MYIHQRKAWPNLTWDPSQIATLLAEARYLEGRLLGRMEALGFQLGEEATLAILTQDVIKTSEIEGEKFDNDQVRSSIAKHLGIDIAAAPPIDRHVEGVVEMLLDATRNYAAPLTKDRLFRWHAALFPTGMSGLRPIITGYWRSAHSGPMRVISGSYGRERIHYEAPHANALEIEMQHFLKWYKNSDELDQLIKAALAHFWFVTIHPFDDGNGRIARAIADMTLAKAENSKQRFYSMSAQIQKERKAYYSILERCQKGSVDITDWIEWFLSCFKRAIGASDAILETILAKSLFWKTYAGASFNDRQHLVINKLLNGSFFGVLNSSKWAKLTKCSQDTALRDINDLLQRGILVKEKAGGRSTSYQLKR